MKYESNILERLIKTYGVVGNPKYVSEIIKQFIIQGKECYPNLFTYQSDWLAHIDEFGLSNDYVVTYTGQYFYAPNTKESPVKRAILKGSTKYRDIDTGEILETFEGGRNLELVSVKKPVLTTIGKNLFNIPLVQGSQTFGTIGGKPTHEFYPHRVTNEPNKYIKVKPNTKITFSLINNDVRFAIAELDEHGNSLGDTGWLNTVSQKTIATKPSTHYIGFNFKKVENTNITVEEVINSNPMLEYSNTYTSYEPHKTNSLKVNEDVTLRGIGDVQDTLDCLTGECVNTIEERVFNGGENWSSNGSSNGVYKYYCNTYTDAKPNATNSISDKVEFVDVNGGVSLKSDVCLTHTTSTGKIQFATTISTTANFKAWLKENPVVVQYERANPVTKTVGVNIKDQNNQVVNHLTSFEGGTHFDTSSQTGSVLPTLEVDVVVDLEETLKTCSLEGNTM